MERLIILVIFAIASSVMRNANKNNEEKTRKGRPQEKRKNVLSTFMENIEKQTRGKFKIDSMKPPGCENALCSFHGNYIYKDRKELISVTHKSTSCCQNEKAEEGAKKAREFVSRNWSSRKVTNPNTKVKFNKLSSWDKILYNINNYSFSISAMVFQDI